MFTSTGGLVIREPGSSSAAVACSGMTMETCTFNCPLEFQYSAFQAFLSISLEAMSPTSLLGLAHEVRGEHIK